MAILNPFVKLNRRDKYDTYMYIAYRMKGTVRVCLWATSPPSEPNHVISSQDYLGFSPELTILSVFVEIPSEVSAERTLFSVKDL